MRRLAKDFEGSVMTSRGPVQAGQEIPDGEKVGDHIPLQQEVSGNGGKPDRGRRSAKAKSGD